ncbi:MAG: tripartite tricarboxylate transporter substrate binding protein [Candidatus Pelethousia sp.]|nr:tripartite tricarboxylate transporter substrate binding protein [Candidatus Pelethousia sp.]
MKMKRKTLALLLIAMLLCVTLLVGCTQKAYPSRSIDVVCAGGAGSGGDVLLRVICKYLQEELAVPVNVINTTGGSGIPAVQSVLDAQADGYTLMGDQAMSSSFQMALAELPYDVFEDRTYICRIASGPQVLCGSPDMGWEDIRDVSEWIKANPDKEFIWGGISKSSAANFAVLEFMMESSIDPANTTELRYSGGGDILAAIAGGHIMLGSCAASGVPSFAQDGQVKPLVVCGSSRLDILPDVPCAAELGFETLNADFWIGFSGSADLPEDVQNTIREACQKMIQDEQFLADIAQIGAVLNYAEGEDMLEDLKNEVELSQKLIALGND